ncbi:putative esterase [Litoreibacter meonggei]|uniref:Putative esterase n=1 Tax=Litoreibacter meonggei TaxID=1049199 RepID=A0A497WQ45_9RHOB|nr:alpha/beta hydrolase-fold protein [Litoreibacter meonggei]RLJ58921.1 putative esterase [Litoreibacter meonggei]
MMDAAAHPDADDLPSWYQEIFPAGPCNGFYQKFEHHAVMCVERDPNVLVVSFDNLAEAGNKNMKREAWAGKFLSDLGVSHMGVFSQGPTWFRDQSLVTYLTMLRDQGFFRRFSRVVFCGTSMGGFAALAFASLSPGAVVMAFSPQSSLDAELVPWEPRFRKGQAQNWELLHSDGAAEIEQASKVYVVYDPFEPLDCAHVDRLSGEHVVRLPAPGLGHKSALVLRRMDRLKSVMASAIQGDLSPLSFAKMIRNRKDIYLYKVNMVNLLTAKNRHTLSAQFAKAFRARRKQRS